MTRTRRRTSRSIAANPVLVGAVALLVVVVAVFLAYNANNGLPFVPSQTIRVLTPSGANLVKGNEVRSGGYRVGVVTAMRPVRLPGGVVGAELELKLDKALGGVPVDSRVRIRPRSALGLKYVELERGRAKELLGDNGVIPAARTAATVELDDLYSTFDAPTRRAVQRNLEGFGDALAGRGAGLNEAVRDAPAFLGRLRDVMANLDDRRSRLDRFFAELGDAARVVAPVSGVNARVFTSMAATFEALSRDPEALQATIAKSPGTLDAGIASFTVQAPFLRRVAAFSRDLSGATAELPAALPPLTRALEVGAPVQRRAVALADDLQDALDAGLELTRAPTTLGAVRGLDATVTTLQPTLRYLGPFVTVCNNWNTFWTFTAEHFTAPDATGGAQRSLLNQGAPQEDSVTSMGANEFVHGHDVRPVNGGVPQHLHANTFGGQAVTPEGRANCQVGQQGYLHAANRFAKDQRTYGRVVVDTPTREQHDLELGSTYRTYDREGNGQGRNLPRVPAGQTFTAEPGGRGVNP